MEIINKIFQGVDRRYLIKSYIFSIALTFLVFSGGPSFPIVIVAILSGILFPFSALVWDSLIDLLMGGNMIILPLPMMVIWKIVKIAFLYGLAIFRTIGTVLVDK